MNSINKTPRRSGAVRHRPRVLPLCVMLMLGSLAMPAAAGTLTVKGNLVSGTCDVTLITPAVMDFGGFTPQDFTDNSGTVAIRNLQIKVDNCDQVTDITHTHVRVSGSGVLTGQNTIFSDTPAGDVGFMVRENGTGEQVWTGGLANFDDTSQAVEQGALTQTGTIDPNQPQGTLLNYAVGFVAKDIAVAPTAGNAVTAQLTFEFVYQ